MTPKEVFVIYDQSDDTIHSVHSFREFAMLERDRLMKTYAEAGKPIPYLRYCVTNLEEAIEWMFSSDYDPAVKILNKLELN